MTIRLSVLVVLVISWASAQGPLRFELKRVEKKAPGCVTTFEYPEIISAASPQARDQINAGMLGVLLRRSDWPAPDSGLASIDAYANEFMKFCGEFQKGPEARELYEHKIVTIFRYTPPILSFQCEASEDGGGVHPFGTTFFVNFDSSTGQPITLGNLFKDGALPKLESIAEATFRREHKLRPTESLSERSYSFPGDRFKLNDNLGVGEKRLVFLFNTYEIGPNAMGETRLEIPYEFIWSLLRFDVRPASYR